MFSDLLARSSTVLLSPSPSHACSRDNPIIGRAGVGRQPPTSNYELLDQAGIAASPPGHTQTRTGVVSLIDRRTSQDHFSGLMRSGHSGPLDKSLSFSCFRHSLGRIGLPSPKICIRRLALNKPSVGQRDKGAKESHGQENHYPGKICHPYLNQPQLQAQYARGLPHFR